MQAPVRPARPRSSGGRTLILLGVLLALAAGAIVIYIVSSAGGGPLSSTVTVVVANQDLPAGSVLSTTQNGVVGGITYIPISAAFVTKSVNSDFAPKDAYIFKSQADLTQLLSGKEISSNFYAGEILRVNDKRLINATDGAPNSMTALNPGKLSNGQVLAQIPLTTKPAVVAGDTVNVLATFCNIPNRPGKCETQTTLKNVYVYAVSGNNVFVVLANQDALSALYISTTATNYELVIRKPGDTTNPTTTPVDNTTISRDFGY